MLSAAHITVSLADFFLTVPVWLHCQNDTCTPPQKEGHGPPEPSKQQLRAVSDRIRRCGCGNKVDTEGTFEFCQARELDVSTFVA